MLTQPLIINNFRKPEQNCEFIGQISLDKPPYDEKWLQDLIHTNPKLIPSGEIEPCFDVIVPILREFSLPSGYLDNFYITPDGYPVLVEVKLWKNQESRRKVVVQILEYAKDFASLTCEKINEQIRNHTDFKGREFKENPLHEIAGEYTGKTIDEVIFGDNLSRNLREGRFLLLILGDGVRDEMASLATHLTHHHSLRYTLGIVQIKLFELLNGAIVAFSSIFAKTQIIERHVTIITTKTGDTSISQQSQPIVTEKIEKTSISLDEFYRSMAEKNPKNLEWLKDLLDKLNLIPQVYTKLDKNLIIGMTVNDKDTQLIRVTPTTLDFGGITYTNIWKIPEFKPLVMTYLDTIKNLVLGAKFKEFPSGSMEIKYGDRDSPLQISQLHGKTAEIADAIGRVVKDAKDFYSSHG